MKTVKRLVFLFLLTAMPLSAQSDVLVLVHGYLGSAHSWEASGVNGVLEANGWRRAGVIALPGQPLPPTSLSGNLSYSVELPYMAPMMIQADHLQAMLNQIRHAHPEESLVIAAHSAGGVVARVAITRGGADSVKGLITIATPHLGTLRAVEALDETDGSGPFGFIKDLFGGGLYQTVKHSWGALVDLTPPRPGSLLYWLNGQAHPEISYHSIVRPGPVGLGDELVPAFSQDMNNVPALKGRSGITQVPSGHALNPADGEVLVRLLAKL